METCIETVHASVTVLTWLSGIMCFVVICLELSRKSIRQFPGNLPLIFSSVALCFNMSLGVGPTVQFKQVDKFEDSDVWRGICLAQAGFYQFCGISTLYWYTNLATVMHSIIVNHTRVHDLRKSARRYYLGGFVIPMTSVIIPWAVGDIYEPRTGGIECWIDDPWWQFGCLYLWVFLITVYGAERSYRIVVVLRRTAYKTGTRLGNSEVGGRRGRTVLSTLKEHLVRQVCFVFLYVIFASINLVYFAWSSLVDRDEDEEDKDPCVLNMLYACNTSLIGAYIALVFGVTRENIKVFKRAWRRVTTSGGRGGTDGDDGTEGRSDLTSPLIQGKMEDGGGNTEALRDAAENLGVIKEGKKEGGEVVTTHLGTKIDARLGIIQSPAVDCTSKFDLSAVSGTSMPPYSHPMTAKLEAMRMSYTNQVLAYVLERIEVLAVDESLAKEFMDAITTESHALFSVGGGGQISRGGRTVSGESTEDYGDEEEGRETFQEVDVEEGGGGREVSRQLPTEEDLDERLRNAKERFEEMVVGKEEGA